MNVGPPSKGAPLDHGIAKRPLGPRKRKAKILLPSHKPSIFSTFIYFLLLRLHFHNLLLFSLLSSLLHSFRALYPSLLLCPIILLFVLFPSFFVSFLLCFSSFFVACDFHRAQHCLFTLPNFRLFFYFGRLGIASFEFFSNTSWTQK